MDILNPVQTSARDMPEMLKERYGDKLVFWDAVLRERRIINDDSIPAIYLSEFDEGLYGGLLGADVRFLRHPGSGFVSSMTPLFVEDWSEFEKWGREPIEKIFGKFNGGVLHLHGNGRHLLPAVSSIRGLKVIHLGNDTGFPPAFDILDELKKKVCPEKTRLSVDIEYKKFRKRLDKHCLHGGVFYDVGAVPIVMRILAIGPHPDDIEFMCAGTLAKYAKRGDKVIMAIATNGEVGSSTLNKEKISKIRRREAQSSASVIEAELIWMDFPDEFLFDNEATRRAFIEMIRKAEPNLIITCPSDDLYHPDHNTTGKIVNDVALNGYNTKY